MRSLLASGAAALGAVLLVLTAPLSAQAATYTLVGNDVSWPQCGTSLPSAARFGVVGVNDGLANTSNPCFAAQLDWARSIQQTGNQPNAQLYVNTANPGKQGRWWPTSTRTQAGTAVAIPGAYGTCSGKVNAGCAYVYGWSMAEQDLSNRGVPAGAWVWWLDVETGNTWSRDATANRADLEAMATVLKNAGGTVGIYSTSYQFGRIAGTLPSTSPLAKAPTWLAGASSQQDAAARCAGASFTGGTNRLVQWVQGGLDYDLSCLD